MTPEEAREKAEIMNIQRIAEPAHAKLVRGPGGRYDYEISYHSETMDGCLDVVLKARGRLESELQKHTGGAV